MARCSICKEPAVNHVEFVVDGKALRIQLDFCQLHADSFLFQVGKLLGTMIKEFDER
jgi:hypothetical protein